MRPAFRLISTLLLAATAGAAFAQEVRVYGAGESVDPQDVARILGSTPAPTYKMRSLKLLDGPAGEGAVAAAQGDAPSGEARRPALALPVQFAFDSADILPTAKPQLDALAAGIRMLSPTQTVRIEGHADARGSDLYNEFLSQKRASTVKRYLIAATGIDPQRLHVVGLGKSDPLPGLDPLSAENRRVQFSGE